MYQLSSVIHGISAFAFLLLLPLPLLLKGEASKLTGRLRFYKVFMIIAHAFIVVLFVTGLLMRFDLTSPWVWLIIMIWLAIGAFLGLTAKYSRLLMEAIEKNQETKVYQHKAIKFSTILALFVVLMFIVKI